MDDWNICPEDVKKKITRKTKAIIAVHYAGWPCDMDELSGICMQNKITLIEDAAHAPGASYKGKKCGTIGDIGCFSFFSNKNLSTGEGGMISSKNKDYISKAVLLRSHGMTSMTIDRHEGKSISYDVIMPGLNYRIDEIKSALGIVQLKKLDPANKKRLTLYRHYIKNLKNIKEIKIPWQNFPNDRIGSGHIFPILLSQRTDRNEFINYLKEKGIQTSIHYPAFNAFSYYKKILTQPLEISDQVSAHVVTLPLYPDLSMNNCEFVCRTIDRFFKNPILK
jgi:dTDP-4-amino-4,6-dideoxygalactose transaminase